MPKTAKKSHERSIDSESVEARVARALAALKKAGTKQGREGLARFGIETQDAVLGVAMADIQRIGKAAGKDHALALALWDTGVYEARLLTAFVAEPERLTAAEMERFTKGFDNWATCDTLCFHLFDRVPHAWSKIEKWSTAREEFVKRTAFALLASIAGHDKTTGDAPFLDGLARIEAAATDERNFVKKAVNWALRRIGRRNVALNAAAIALSQRLAAATDPTARWVGRGALKELESAVVKRALQKTQAAKVAKKKKGLVSGRGSRGAGA